MQAGKLTQRIRIEAPESTQDEIGQPTQGWALVAEVWADIRLLGGLESIRADVVTSSTQASIRIRWRAGIDASMRVVHGATVYGIRSVNPDVARRQFVDLICETNDAQD